MYNNILPPNPLSTPPPSLSQRVCLILENASYISHETSRGLSVRSSTRVTRHFVRPSTRPYAVPRGRYAVSNFRHLNIISEATCIDLLPGPRGDQIARMWLYGSIEFVGLSRFFFFFMFARLSNEPTKSDRSIVSWSVSRSWPIAHFFTTNTSWNHLYRTITNFINLHGGSSSGKARFSCTSHWKLL